METISNKDKAREYLLKEHLSPLNNILYQCDLKTEFQYHKDIENAFIKGAELKDKQHEQEKREWLNKAYDVLKPLLDPDSLMVVQQKLLELVYKTEFIE